MQIESIYWFFDRFYDGKDDQSFDKVGGNSRDRLSKNFVPISRPVGCKQIEVVMSKRVVVKNQVFEWQDFWMLDFVDLIHHNIECCQLASVGMYFIL